MVISNHLGLLAIGRHGEELRLLANQPVTAMRRLPGSGEPAYGAINCGAINAINRAESRAASGVRAARSDTYRIPSARLTPPPTPATARRGLLPRVLVAESALAAADPARPDSADVPTSKHRTGPGLGKGPCVAATARKGATTGSTAQRHTLERIDGGPHGTTTGNARVKLAAALPAGTTGVNGAPTRGRRIPTLPA